VSGRNTLVYIGRCPWGAHVQATRDLDGGGLALLGQQSIGSSQPADVSANEMMPGCRDLICI
jgi:hypothetical protein